MLLLRNHGPVTIGHSTRFGAGQDAFDALQPMTDRTDRADRADRTGPTYRR